MRFKTLSVLLLLSMLLMAGCRSLPPLPAITANLNHDSLEEAQVVEPLAMQKMPPMPDGLRPCCAFGYDLKVKLLQFPIPLYRVNNVLTIEQLGRHIYNDSFWRGISSVLGLSAENLGVMYTRKGGFIDIAHVRDTADYSYYLFTQIYPRLGQQWTLPLGRELAERKVQFYAFDAPKNQAERYNLSVYLAAHLAYQLAVWHEIVQWYGYHSVPGFSEQISAFTPEDLYSNLLGARLSMTVLNQGHVSSIDHFNAAMQAILPSALQQLDAQSAEETRRVFDRVDGQWWDKSQRVPSTFLVLKRHYNIDDDRLPLQPEHESESGLRLALPRTYHQYDLAQLAQLQYWPSKNMGNLPIKDRVITATDFPALMQQAKDEAEVQYQQLEKK